MTLFTFCFRQEKSFLDKFGTQKVKIVRLRWNFVPRLIWICRTQWRCSLFLFYTRNTLFGKQRKKKSNYCPCDLTGWSKGFETDGCRQHGCRQHFYILLREVRPWIVFAHCLLKFLHNVKRKQTFSFIWTNFFLKKLSCQILI